MKKGIIMLVFSVLFFGCKSQSVTNTNVDNKIERAIKGNFIITNVMYPGSDYIKITSFDIADANCFVNSEWSFVSNNNKGTLALNSSSCSAFSSPITWFVNDEGQFVMKVLNNVKSKNVTAGYILSIVNLTDNSFQLVDKVNVGGKIVNVVYQFQKQ